MEKQMSKTTFKSIRLNSAIRADIKNSMIEAYTKKQPKPHDLDKVIKAIGDRLWNEAYGKLKPYIKKLPEQMLRWSDSINVQIKGTVCSYKMSENRPHPHHSEYNKAVVAVYDEVPDDIAAYRKAKDADDFYNQALKDFKNEITIILDSVTTTGQLVQLWPEAEQYLPPFAADPSKGINLPALKTSRLNTLLGIK